MNFIDAMSEGSNKSEKSLSYFSTVMESILKKHDSDCDEGRLCSKLALIVYPIVLTMFRINNQQRKKNLVTAIYNKKCYSSVYNDSYRN